jgi:hypothetical protein
VQVLRNVKRRARMDSEIELLRRLSHPNVMGLRDLYESKDAALLLMDLMCGGSLRERIEQRGGVPFDERLAAHFVRQITLGLAYLHEQVGARRANAANAATCRATHGAQHGATGRAWSTGTSSPKTSSDRIRVKSRSPISASPGFKAAAT